MLLPIEIFSTCDFPGRGLSVHWSVSLSVDKYVWATFLYRLRHVNGSCNLAVAYPKS